LIQYVHTYVSNTANTKRIMKKSAIEALAARASHFGRGMDDNLALRLSLIEAERMRQ
jgi:hypothetical protein